MSEEVRKALKSAIAGELKPILSGLRKDFKNQNETIERLVEVIETNEPLTKTVEVSNPVDNSESLQLLYDINSTLASGQDESNKQFLGTGEYVKSYTAEFLRAFKNLGSKTFNVKVENPVEFPETFEVSNLGDIVIPEPLEKVGIANSTPSQAIPVRLVDRTGKKFYEVLTTLAGGGNKASVNVNSTTVITVTTDKSESVGTSSVSILAANADRKEVIITKVNSGGIITINRSGGPAVDNAGITLTAKGSTYVMEPNGLVLGELFAISSAAGGILAISEGE
jgi:hypothetical protein